MKNVTIVVDDDVARWAKVWAARHDTSVSRMVGEALREKMNREDGYESARRRYLAQGPRTLKEAGASYLTREESHER